jgi:hypothetical protein
MHAQNPRYGAGCTRRSFLRTAATAGAIGFILEPLP